MSPSNNEPLATSPEQPPQGAAQQSTDITASPATQVQNVPPIQVSEALQSDAAPSAPSPASASAPSSVVVLEPNEVRPSEDVSPQGEIPVEQASEQPMPEGSAVSEEQTSGAERPNVPAKNAARVSANDQIPDPLKKAKRKRLIKRIGIALIALFVAAAIGIAAFSVWTIWYRFDDAADIQGTWINSDGVAVTFDASQMHLQSGVSFDYSLNSGTKEIDYSFSRSTGHGVYRFAKDRQILIIDEKGKTDWFLILEAKEDPALQGTPPDGVTVFRRAS